VISPEQAAIRPRGHVCDLCVAELHCLLSRGHFGHGGVHVRTSSVAIIKPPQEASPALPLLSSDSPSRGARPLAKLWGWSQLATLPLLGRLRHHSERTT
jgi:hypothetical protein